MNLTIIIPVYFPSTESLSLFSERLRTAIFPALHPASKITLKALPKGATPSIQSRSDLAKNSQYVLAIAKEAEAQGSEGVYVTDMDMCGVEIAREHLSVPIIGGFTANTATALSICRRFSIITILDSVVDMQLEHIYSGALQDRFASIKVAKAPVSELLDDPEKTSERVYRQAYAAVTEDGAEALILGCTGFIGIADQVRQRLKRNHLDIPVLDPNRVAISFLQHLVLSGISQSKRTYRAPPLTESETVKNG